MARSRDVRTLYHLSMVRVRNLIISTSKFICRGHNSFASAKLKKKVFFVQRFILNHIHPHFLDEIINCIDKGSSFNWIDKEKSCVVGVCMHPRMRVFKPKFQLPVDDDLYMFQLNNMNHLRSLSLSMVCSDEILEVVGKSCPLLEFIDITSKVDSGSNRAIRFNALKLRFFVSDKGLEHLHQCKCLQTVIMNGIIRSNCGGRKISNVGIKNLLLNLNMLKYISYQDMGLVLDEISDAEKKLGLLNLVHLQDNHVTVEHINLFALLCPKLESLSLCVPQTNSNEEDLSEPCLDCLTTNSTVLKSIELWFFKFSSSMINFLTLKGKYLTNLTLKDCLRVDIKALQDICIHCTNLKSLKINLLNQSDNYVFIPTECSFKCLEELHLAGNKWDPTIIFNMCIVESIGLRALSLSNKGFTYKLDCEIKSLMSKNPLPVLSDLALLEGCRVSFPLLKDFLLHCSNLSRITVIDDNRENLSEQLICFISTYPNDVSLEIKYKRS